MVDNKEKENRSFTVALEGEKAITYYIADPTSEDIRKADWHYSKVYNQALLEGLATQAEMAEILVKRKIAGPDYESKGEEIRKRLVDKIEAMGVEDDPIKQKVLALDVALAREELFNHNQKVNGPMSNTCEQIAEDARVEFLTSRLVESEPGKKVWNSFEGYKEDARSELTMQARLEVMLWLQGLESNFMENTPENVVLRAPYPEDELEESEPKKVRKSAKKKA